jgi:hypothetical protein
MHSREHPVGLCCSLVQHLHRLQLQGSAEGVVVSPTHRWRLVHPATIWKAEPVQVHQSWNQVTGKRLIQAIRMLVIASLPWT